MATLSACKVAGGIWYLNLEHTRQESCVEGPPDVIGPDCGRAGEAGASFGPVSEETARRGSTWQMSWAFLTPSTHSPRYQSRMPLIPFGIWSSL